ncbi:circadian clock-controlled protein daywake-like [Onthophagus taurus]|uniref:circadian clock-controlled protein daywake-like n=1 Tax=Onthophagus taurus TaxID=166361 RepID=UPI000C20BE01|nr:uncharacterized protein LOC111420282 [Onthophagus taurus]
MLRAVGVLVIYLLFGIATSNNIKPPLPSYVNVCKRFDPEIAKCWKKTFEGLIPHLVKGIPEFKVPPIEPFFIDNLQLNLGNGTTIRFVADLTNVTCFGIQDVKVVSVEPNYKTLTIKLDLIFSKLVMKALYKANGRILLFRFDSAGNFDGEFKQVYVKAFYQLETYEKDKIEHIRIKHSTHDVDVKSMSLYLHNLFKNNPEITASVNRVINDNIHILYKDFKPLLQRTIGGIITDYANRAYSQYSFNTLLPIN